MDVVGSFNMPPKAADEQWDHYPGHGTIVKNAADSKGAKKTASNAKAARVLNNYGSYQSSALLLNTRVARVVLFRTQCPRIILSKP